MVGWHPRLNGNEFEQTPWDSEGQGSLGCCKSMGLDRMEQLNNNRSGSEDLRKLNPLYKFMQFIHDAGIGTLVCAFKHNKIILSHWRNLNSSKLMAWHPGTPQAVVPLMKGLTERAYIQNHYKHSAITFPSEMITNLISCVLCLLEHRGHWIFAFCL